MATLTDNWRCGICGHRIKHNGFLGPSECPSCSAPRWCQARTRAAAAAAGWGDSRLTCQGRTKHLSEDGLFTCGKHLDPRDRG